MSAGATLINALPGRATRNPRAFGRVADGSGILRALLGVCGNFKDAIEPAALDRLAWRGTFQGAQR